MVPEAGAFLLVAPCFGVVNQSGTFLRFNDNKTNKIRVIKYFSLNVDYPIIAQTRPGRGVPFS